MENYKSQFYKGEEFSVGNLKVTCEYENGDKVILQSSDYTVDSSLYNKNVIDSYKIKVTFKTCQNEYTVNVVEKGSGDNDITYPW